MNDLNFDFLCHILENENTEDKETLFFSLINSLKNNWNLYKYIDIEWIKNILNKIELIENIYEKADLINFLLSVIYENEFEINYKCIENLFYSYLEILKNGYSIQLDIINTFSLFMNLGISSKTVWIECIKLYPTNYCIHLFSKLPFHFEGHNKEIDFLIIQHKKVIIRFDLILHFYLITNFDYVENILIAGDYLKKYYNYMSICADWAFSDENNDDRLVQENIITKKELELFIELGNLLNKYKKFEETTNTEEKLFKDLYIASNKFKSLLNSNEIKSIKKRFIEERDFFEIALHLPEN